MPGALRGRGARIAPGCPLSRLIGVLYLKLLDEPMETTGLAYARFRDDWVTAHSGASG